MNKIISRILIVVSIIIIVFGIFAGKSVKNELKAEGMPTQNIYIDGTDVTSVTEIFVEIGSGLLDIIMIVYSILAVICIWVIYGIVMLVLFIIKKCKEKRNIDEKSIDEVNLIK